MSLLTLPIRLTLIRLIVSPIILPFLLVYLLPYNVLWVNVLLGILFVLLSLTDFFDGYLARKYNQETVLGRVLDPLADKFLTYSALIALLAANKIYFYWVVILVGRELFVMGLRHVALEHGFTVSVSKIAKCKTAVMMVYITALIVNPYQGSAVYAVEWQGVQMGLLLITITLSLISAHQYYDEFMVSFRHGLDKDDVIKELKDDQYSF